MIMLVPIGKSILKVGSTIPWALILNNILKGESERNAITDTNISLVE